MLLLPYPSPVGLKTPSHLPPPPPSYAPGLQADTNIRPVATVAYEMWYLGLLVLQIRYVVLDVGADAESLAKLANVAVLPVVAVCCLAPRMRRPCGSRHKQTIFLTLKI